MDTKMTQEEINEKVRTRFKELPKVVQDAITSTDVQKMLRRLADTNNLHLDQWQLLENEVLLTLLGFQPPEELADNIRVDLDIPVDTASSLAREISSVVFEPIRQELERELEHPEAKKEVVSDVESTRAALLEKAQAESLPPDVQSAASSPQPVANETQPEAGSPKQEDNSNLDSATSYKPPATSLPTPATPPPPPPATKAERSPLPSGPASGAYKPGETSATRKIVEDDPYRETPA